MDAKTVLIVGLGNPGQKYELTRHNIGFLAVDHLLKTLDGSTYKEEKKSLLAKVTYRNTNVLIAKPQTFMNLSGESVQALMTFYKIKKEDILVVHDDLDIPFGAIRFFYNRSPGGHNGIKSIHERLGSEYSRLKLGIRADMGQIPVESFVLMNFDSKEQAEFKNLFEYTDKCIRSFIDHGHDLSSNNYNRKAGFFS